MRSDKHKAPAIHWPGFSLCRYRPRACARIVLQTSTQKGRRMKEDSTNNPQSTGGTSPLSDHVHEALRARAQAQATTSPMGVSFLSTEGAHISYFCIAKSMIEVRRSPRLAERSCSLLSSSRAFATDMLDKGGNLSLVQKMFRQESISQPRVIYIRN